MDTVAATSAALTSSASLARASIHQEMTEVTTQGLQRQAQVPCGVSPTGLESRSRRTKQTDKWSEHGQKSLRANPAFGPPEVTLEISVSGRMEETSASSPVY
jgi:hypothetical protein